MSKAAKTFAGEALPGPGRPRLGNEVMKPHPFRMSDSQYAKVMRLGGADWIRQQIDEAVDPAKTKRTKGANTK